MKRSFPVVVLLLLAALTLRPQAAHAHWFWFGFRPPPPPPIDSPAFQVRPPPPGRPGYLETITYVDNGLQYVDRKTGFFVSADGRMCFVGVLDVRRTTFERRQAPWCAAPAALAAIDTIENDITYVPQLRLWCRHAVPQCFQEIGRPYLTSDSIAVEIIPSHREREALAYLIYLMGGSVPARRIWGD